VIKRAFEVTALTTMTYIT